MEQYESFLALTGAPRNFYTQDSHSIICRMLDAEGRIWAQAAEWFEQAEELNHLSDFALSVNYTPARVAITLLHRAVKGYRFGDIPDLTSETAREARRKGL